LILRSLNLVGGKTFLKQATKGAAFVFLIGCLFFFSFLVYLIEYFKTTVEATGLLLQEGVVAHN